MKSIIQTEQRCFLCNKLEPLHVHHCINGTANRKNSDKWGLMIYLCPTCHEKVHNDQELDESVKKVAQRNFELLYGHELWMKTFRKNYL